MSAAQNNEENDEMKKEDFEEKKKTVVSLDNKDSLLREIDDLISTIPSKKKPKENEETPKIERKSKPPAIEYLFVEPYGSFRIFGSFGFGFNPYGQLDLFFI